VANSSLDVILPPKKYFPASNTDLADYQPVKQITLRAKIRQFDLKEFAGDSFGVRALIRWTAGRCRRLGIIDEG
jgi:hypothetical protein